jgi:hypothetical protein
MTVCCDNGTVVCKERGDALSGTPLNKRIEEGVHPMGSASLTILFNGVQNVLRKPLLGLSVAGLLSLGLKHIGSC